MTLSEYLTHLRNSSELTYQNIADMTGLHINTVQNIINGKTRSTTFDKAQRLVIALGGSLDVLKKLDYAEGDIMAIEAKSIPDDPHVLSDYSISVETRMQYAAAISRERQLNRFLGIALICATLLLLLVTVAVIALFVYDFTHPDRGWWQTWHSLSMHI